MSTETTPATEVVANEVVANEVPAVEEKKAKRGKKAKPSYPGLVDAEGNAVQLAEVPADYDPEKYSLLKDVDFADEAVYHDWRVSYYEDKCNYHRKQAELCRSFESEEERKNYLRVLKLEEELAKLMGTGAVDPARLEALKEMKS